MASADGLDSVAQGPGAHAPPIIERKLVPPPLPERLVDRPRLDKLVSGLLRTAQLVWVCGTAGSGKTTAVLQATRHEGRPLAWLTLNDSDRAPGRLVTYLEAALTRVQPSLADVATGALARRVPHAEAAGLLAEAAQGPLVVVIDEVERLAASPDAVAVLSSFVRYAGRGLRLILISRRELPRVLGDFLPAGAATTIGEAELAFTADEAAAALAAAGDDTTDPGAAIEATGGWVTGVLFESWRSVDHVMGQGGEEDPLHGYLASQILAELDDGEREFLIDTSVLDLVTPRRAEFLGQQAAGATLLALRGKHLPVTWEPGNSMRCHPRLREYLRTCLDRRGAERVRQVRAAHAMLLVAEGYDEDAVEELLAVDLASSALPAMQRAIGTVIERLDFAVAERWLAAIPDGEAHPPLELAVAELMLALGQEQYSRGAAVGDALAAQGLRDELLRTVEQAATVLAWCYFHVGRIADAFAILNTADTPPGDVLVRYLLTLASGDETAWTPPLSGGPLDGLILRLHWAHGHLQELLDPPESRWAAAVSGPWRVAALRAIGQTEEALELLEAVRTGEQESGLHDLVGAEALVDLGDREAAWAALARARRKIQRSGSAFLLLLSFLLEAKIELRLNRNSERALQVLQQLDLHPCARAYVFVTEQASTWRGMALLSADQNLEALDHLRDAVSTMLSGDRILELPTAAVFLSEAEWRADNEEAADAAADAALDAAARQGSNHLLLQALNDFPEVVARRMDAESEATSPWHELARALIAQGHAGAFDVPTVIDLREFGELKIAGGGVTEQPRLKKVYELVAWLACRQGQDAERSELLDGMFNGRGDESTRAYLRQLLHQAREVLPELRIDARVVGLGDGVTLRSQSLRFEAALAEAARLQGEARLRKTRDALQLYNAGPYLPGIQSVWSDSRREHLDALAQNARMQYAELAFRHGRFKEAAELASTVLAHDPLRESAWQLKMRLSSAVGDDDAVLGAFRGARDELAKLGLDVSPETRRLINELRS